MHQNGDFWRQSAVQCDRGTNFCAHATSKSATNQATDPMQNSRALILILLLNNILAVRSEAAPVSDLWAFWQPEPAPLSESKTQAPISHELWQQLLDRYLSAAEDQINRFDYQAVTAADRALLARYLDTLTSLDPRGYPIDEQMAYWINLYNALTVQVMLDNTKKFSILRMGCGLFRVGP